MAQAVEAAEGRGSPPPELQMAWRCERWNALPDAGGIYDQDAQLMTRMDALQNVYKTVTRVRSMKGEQIHQLTDHERRLLRALMDEGIFS